MTEKRYGITTRLDLSYEEAVERTRAALKEEGFGVLTEIDVKAALKKKLNADFRKYVILGACNPPLAHRGSRRSWRSDCCCLAASSSTRRMAGRSFQLSIPWRL
jgi:hypothetical protein